MYAGAELEWGVGGCAGERLCMSDAFVNLFSILFLRQDLQLNWSQIDLAGMADHYSQGSACPSLPSAGIIDTHSTWVWRPKLSTSRFKASS